MVHAINQHGMETYFSDRVWNLMPKHKNGWVEFSDKLGESVIPQQIIEFQAKLKKDAVVEEKNEFVEKKTAPMPVKKNHVAKTKKQVKR